MLLYQNVQKEAYHTSFTRSLLCVQHFTLLAISREQQFCIDIDGIVKQTTSL